jgi:hypothetical protein
MTLEQWELYRLSVADQMPDSPSKAAILNAINHNLTMLKRQPEGRP